MQWTRLVRFEGKDGKVHSGDAVVTRKSKDPRESTHARVIHGNPFGNYTMGPAIPIKRLLQPLPYTKVRTVRALGLNYRLHAEESGLSLPDHPIVFYKPATAVSGPVDDILVPEMYQQSPTLDYEVELVVVIGKECYNVPEKDALKYVAGYTVGNDVSHREWQHVKGSQWSLGKSHDTFAPIGPAIVRHLNPKKLEIKSFVNDNLRQQASTSAMIYDVAKAIAFLSKTATLVPGDLIFMGTPNGVGMGRSPPEYLNDGDVVECYIQGIGTIRNTVRYIKAKEQRSFRKSKL